MIRGAILRIPRAFVKLAILAGGMVIALTSVFALTFEVAAQSNYEIIITVNHFGEFWWEMGLFGALAGFGASVVVWGSMLVGRDPVL